MSAPTSDGAWFTGRRPTHHPATAPGQFLDELDAPEWMAHGLCAQTDPEAFFPEKGGSTRDAKQVCLACDVRDECLAYALERQERYGIWGGLSERERRKLTRSPNSPPRPCARPGCTETIPPTAHGSRRFHNPECAALARKQTTGAA